MPVAPVIFLVWYKFVKVLSVKLISIRHYVEITDFTFFAISF